MSFSSDGHAPEKIVQHQEEQRAVSRKRKHADEIQREAAAGRGAAAGARRLGGLAPSKSGKSPWPVRRRTPRGSAPRPGAMARGTGLTARSGERADAIGH